MVHFAFSLLLCYAHNCSASVPPPPNSTHPAQAKSFLVYCAVLGATLFLSLAAVAGSSANHFYRDILFDMLGPAVRRIEASNERLYRNMQRMQRRLEVLERTVMLQACVRG